MTVNIFAYSDKGCVLAKKIATLFDDSHCYAVEKFAIKYNINPVKSTCGKVAEVFAKSQLIIFVGACGIAVRAIAPCVKSKVIDPACLVVDDCANFVISILSGHIGGGNEYCKLVSEHLNSTPVITTATDINKRFSVDTFAKKQGFFISSMKNAMEFSSQILTHDLPISFCNEVTVKTNLANGLFEDNNGELGVCINYKKITPYNTTLNLVPKILHIGIGCRRNTPLEKIEKLFLQTLKDENIHIKSVKSIASIDLKSDEIGLLEFCYKFNLPVNFYTSEQLISLNGSFSASNFVKSITGVDNVCERSAVMASKNGKLIVKKTSLDGVTIAIAAENIDISFE